MKRIPIKSNVKFEISHLYTDAQCLVYLPKFLINVGIPNGGAIFFMVYLRFGAPGNHHGNPSFVISLPLKASTAQVRQKVFVARCSSSTPARFLATRGGIRGVSSVSDTHPAQFAVQKSPRRRVSCFRGTCDQCPGPPF